MGTSALVSGATGERGNHRSLSTNGVYGRHVTVCPLASNPQAFAQAIAQATSAQGAVANGAVTNSSVQK